MLKKNLMLLILIFLVYTSVAYEDEPFTPVEDKKVAEPIAKPQKPIQNKYIIELPLRQQTSVLDEFNKLNQIEKITIITISVIFVFILIVGIWFIDDLKKKRKYNVKARTYY